MLCQLSFIVFYVLCFFQAPSSQTSLILGSMSPVSLQYPQAVTSEGQVGFWQPTEDIVSD